MSVPYSDFPRPELEDVARNASTCSVSPCTVCDDLHRAIGASGAGASRRGQKRRRSGHDEHCDGSLVAAAAHIVLDHAEQPAGRTARRAPRVIASIKSSH